MKYDPSGTISKSKHPSGILNFIFERFTYCLALLFAVCLTTVYWQLSRNHDELVERTALQHAEVYSAAIEEFRSLYTSEVVETARKAGLTVSHDYRNREHAIPLPATLSMDLARKLGEHDSGSQTFLYSPYPFPFRKEEGGLRDTFAKDAWARLSKAPDEPFYQIELYRGKRVLRYAKADRMRAACVNCHNTHPDSPKRDWKVGDTRGVLEVVYPLEHAESLARSGLNQTMGILGPVFLLALVTIGFAFAKYKSMLSTILARQEELQIKEENLSTTLDSIGDAVITTDAEGEVVRMNPVAEKLTGWTLEEAKGKALTEVFNIVEARTNEPAVDPVKRVLESGATTGLVNDTILIAKDGTEHQIADSAAPIVGKGGNIEGVVLVFRDVTEEYRMQAQTREQQKLESIGTLAGGVAHEINNPINGIMNYAQLISDRLDPESPLREFSDGIGQETKRVAEIVRNLLAFARQEKESHSPARIADIINDTLSLIRTIIHRDQITLEVDVPDGLPKIKCRSQQIQQVLMNLLTNARDALNERYREHDPDKIIMVTVRPFEKEGEPWLRVTVEDHGAGVPDEIRGHLFDPFFTTKDRTKGTGLGLSISHGIVKDHRGELSVECKAGQYTRFHLNLPVDNDWSLSGAKDDKFINEEDK